jgi:3-hydroxyacyl-[acyl-carrier-protein] dehydratase
MISLTPGVTGVGEYRVRGDEYYLRGHLPGEPILPGVLLVEAGAQVAGMVAQEDPANPRWPRMKLTALRAVKILGSARPGETLRIEASSPAVWVPDSGQVTAFIADTKVLSAELALSGSTRRHPKRKHAEPRVAEKSRALEHGTPNQGPATSTRPGRLQFPSAFPPRFQFERDTFAFAHELVWKYQFDPVTGAMTTLQGRSRRPRIITVASCMVRATRLFFDHARFAPELPPADAEAYRKLIREDHLPQSAPGLRGIRTGRHSRLRRLAFRSARRTRRCSRRNAARRGNLIFCAAIGA